MTGENTGGDGAATTNQSDIEQLRAENERLKRQVADAQEKKAYKSTPWWRRALVVLLLIIGSIGVALGSIAIWLTTTALDTDTFVETIEPLPKNEDVALAVSTAATQSIFEDGNVEESLSQALPEGLQFLAAPLTEALQQFTVELGVRIIMSDQFSTVWIETNRFAHEQTVALLTGEGDTVLLRAGQAVIDLNGVVDQIDAALQERGIDFLADRDGALAQITVQLEDNLGPVQDTVNLLDSLSWWLAVIGVLAFIGAIALSPKRRRTLLHVGVLTAVVTGITLILLRLIRRTVLDETVTEVGRNGVEAIWDTVFRGLVNQQRGLLVLGIILAVVAAAFGPKSWAVSLRETVASWTTAGRERVGVGGETGKWVERHLTTLRTVGIMLAFFVLLLAPLVTLALVLIVAVVLAIYLVALELLRTSTGDVAMPDDEEPGDDGEESAQVSAETGAEDGDAGEE